MINECDIVRDLIPLYVEDRCSDASKQFVESHIAQCDACRIELSYATKSQEYFEANDQEGVEVLKSISTRWKKEKKMSVLKGATVISFLASLFSILASIKIGSYVDENGFVQEPFYLIIIFYFFLMLGLVFSAILIVRKLIEKFRK